MYKFNYIAAIIEDYLISVQSHFPYLQGTRNKQHIHVHIPYKFFQALPQSNFLTCSLHETHACYQVALKRA